MEFRSRLICHSPLVFSLSSPPGLASVTIAEGVTSIGGYAFSGCTGLTDVYCRAEEVPTTDNTFSNSSYRSATLHVPAASLEAYKTSQPWSDFGSIVPLTDEDAIVNVKASTVTSETTRFDIQGRQINTLQKGINILRYSDGTTRKVMVK